MDGSDCRLLTGQRSNTQRSWAAGLAAMGWAVLASACPGEGPISVLVPYAAGGSVDATTRVVVNALSAHLKRTVLSVNVPGASGLIAVRQLLAAARDGCTLLSATVNNVVLLPLQNPHAGFMASDLQPLARIGATGMVLLASARSGLRDMAALQAAAHTAQPLRAGHPGVDSLQAMALNLLETRLHTHFIQVPYSGAGQMVNDLAGGHLDLAVLALPAAMPLVKHGTATLLDAVRTPDGVPLSAWSGFFAARDVPPLALSDTQRALLETLANPAVVRALANLGVEVHPNAAHSFVDEIAASTERLRPVVRPASGSR